MAFAFMAARAVARMIREGISFEQTGVPTCMKTTEARLDGGGKSDEKREQRWN